MDASPYRLTIIASIVVLVLSVGVVVILGGAASAAPYLGLVATAAVPGLLALAKAEQTSANVGQLHRANTEAINANTETTDATLTKLDSLAQALVDAGAVPAGAIARTPPPPAVTAPPPASVTPPAPPPFAPVTVTGSPGAAPPADPSLGGVH